MLLLFLPSSSRPQCAQQKIQNWLEPNGQIPNDCFCCRKSTDSTSSPRVRNRIPQNCLGKDLATKPAQKGDAHIVKVLVPVSGLEPSLDLVSIQRFPFNVIVSTSIVHEEWCYSNHSPTAPTSSRGSYPPLFMPPSPIIALIHQAGATYSPPGCCSQTGSGRPRARLREASDASCLDWLDPLSSTSPLL